MRVEAKDNAGNPRVAEFRFNAIYQFSGFLSPIRMDGISLYRQGRTLPVKFQLADGVGNSISTATAHLFVTKVSDGIAGTEEAALSTGNSDTGNVFRYDVTDDQYVFNLSLDLNVGTWQLRVELDDGKEYVVEISIRQ